MCITISTKFMTQIKSFKMNHTNILLKCTDRTMYIQCEIYKYNITYKRFNKNRSINVNLLSKDTINIAFQS